MVTDLFDRIGAGFPDTLDRLRELVRIPSISADGHPPGEVERSAAAVAELLRNAGYDDVRTLEIDGAHPAVYGVREGPAGSPTVLLYAHHDVQPPGPETAWSTPPFEPVERDGRLHGRGTADDKCGVVTHAAVLRAFGGRPPVTIKVFIEGEEEIGSRHLERFLARHGALLAADAIVIADSENWRVGIPALTTSLRGLVDCVVEVRTLRAAVHSGQFGGPIVDAITALARIIATLHNADGNVAVPGLVSGEADPLDLTEEEFRAQAGTVAGLRLVGSGSLTARLWRRPAISVVALDAPPIDRAINQLVPVARAKVSLRIAPGDDPRRAMEALRSHLEAAAEWGVEVRIRPGATGEPFAADGDDPATRAFREAMEAAYGRPPVEIGIGGSIPFVAAFRERFPEAAIVLTGAADPTSAAHGPDESLDVADLERAIRAEALALRLLGEHG